MFGGGFDFINQMLLGIDSRPGQAGLAAFTGSAHNAGRATEKFERTTKNLSNALAVLGGYFATRRLVEYADTWTLINARVKLVTDSHEQAITVQQRLYDISQKTRNTLAATSVLYTRVALNADQLGRSHEDLLGVVSAVNSAMLLSGSTGVEAAQAMRQFAQALGSGRVQGDEFRTMMEAMPMVARAIADEMGANMGDLYKLSAEGLIDVQIVIDALLKRQQELEELAANMPWTVGQAFVYFANAITRVVGIVNMSIGATNKLADMLKFLGDNVGRIIGLMATMAAGMITYRTAVLGAAIASQALVAAKTIRAFAQLAVQIRTLSDALVMLQIASGVLITIASLVVGFLAYQKIVDGITNSTQEWATANEDLNKQIGLSTELTEELAEAQMRQAQSYLTGLRVQIDTLEMSKQALQEQIDLGKDARRSGHFRQGGQSYTPEEIEQITAGRRAAAALKFVEEALDDLNSQIPIHEARLKGALAALEEFASSALAAAQDIIRSPIGNGALFDDLIDATVDAQEELKELNFQRLISGSVEEVEKLTEKIMLLEIQLGRLQVATRAALDDWIADSPDVVIGLVDSDEGVAETLLRLKREWDSFYADLALANYRTVDLVAEAWIGAMRNIQSDLADGFEDVFRDGLDGFDSFVDSVLDMFIQLAAEIAAAMTIEKLGIADILNDMKSGGGGLTGLRGMWIEAVAKLAASAVVGGAIGSAIGRQTGSAEMGTLGGVAGGAAMGAMIGGVPGATIGALAGAIGGLIGATDAQRAETEAHRQAMLDNTESLRKLREEIEGVSNVRYIEALATVRDFLLISDLTNRSPDEMPQWWRDQLEGMAEELGITLTGNIESYEALEEALELVIVSLTQFGNTLSDIRKQQELEAALYRGGETSNQQALENQLAVLAQLAPELLAQLGLGDVDLSTEGGRAEFLAALQEIYQMILSGAFTDNPALLGAFGDIDTLSDWILSAVDALEAFNKELYKVTTDFPRAMDIIYYEQKYGKYGGFVENSRRIDDAIITEGTGIVIHGDVIIRTDPGDDGEDILNKLEDAAYARRARGGTVELQ